MAFSKQFPSTIKTSNIIIPNIADFEIENPLKKTIFCNGVEIVTTPEFSRKGVVVVEVDNVILFDSRNTNGFSNIASMPINLNAELPRDMFVRIFAFNQVDTNTIECTVNVFLDEVSKSLDSKLTYISTDIVNSVVSEQEILFPLELRAENSVTTKLITLTGYKKLILVMTAGAYLDTVIALIGGANVVDGDLFTLGNGIFMDRNTAPTVFASVDFGSIANRTPSAKLNKSNSDNVYTISFQKSDNNIDWTEIDSAVVSSAGDTTFDSTPGDSFRYLRLVVSFTAQNNPTAITTFASYQIYDGTFLGGVANLSFEVEDGFGDFKTLISASSIGAVTQGNFVLITIGDVINDVGNSKFNFALPSTQTGFRAKLTIDSDGINIGVSIEKIS